MCPRSWIVVAAFTILASVNAGAQGLDTCALSGHVIDSTRAVIVSARVTLSGPNLIGGPRHVSTGPDGAFHFTALPPGTYDLVAEAAGFRERRTTDLRIPAGGTIVLDALLEAAGVTQELEVRGSAPLVDVTSSAVPVNIDQQMLHDLPTSRWVPSLINLVPGVAADAALGGTQASNGMFVDGVDITEPHYQDAAGRINYNWLEEVQIVGLGASAQHGEFTGVSARATLRSGTNRYSALLEAWASPSSWTGTNTGSLERDQAKTFASKEQLAFWDTSAQLGGPIVRDRLWFFGGFERLTDDSRPAGYQWAGSTRKEDPRLIVKLTGAPSSSVRLEGFVSHSSNLIIGDGIDAYTPIEAAWNTHGPQTNWNTKFTWTLGARTLIEARLSGTTGVSYSDPHGPGTKDGPPPRWDGDTGLYSDNVWFTYKMGGSRLNGGLALTRSIDHALGGRHEIRAGLELERAHSSDAMHTPGGIAFDCYGGEPYMAYLGGDFSYDTTTARTTVYAQDDWNVGSRITLSPGVRISSNRGGKVSGGWAFTTTPVDPRIGVAWDVGADHKTVIRAHVGRYHDALFSSRLNSDVGASYQEPLIFAMVLGPGEYEEINRYDPGPVTPMQSGVKHSYADQFVVGAERQLKADLSVQAQYIQRNFRNFMGMIDTGSIWAPTTQKDTGPDAVAGTADDGGTLTTYQKTNPGNETFVYANPEGAHRGYKAFQVIAKKRYSHNWQLQASYTWSRNTGNVTNVWHVNAARYDLGNPGTFVNPNVMINADGNAPFDFTHEFKVLGSYRLPLWGGFLVSGVYRAHTGYAWGRKARVNLPNMGSARGVRVEPRGTRRTPAINNLDLRVEKTIRFGSRQTLGLFLDAFNLGNQGVPNAEEVNPVQELSGPIFGQPLTWVDPRTFRAGVRFTF